MEGNASLHTTATSEQQRRFAIDVLIGKQCIAVLVEYPLHILVTVSVSTLSTQETPFSLLEVRPVDFGLLAALADVRHLHAVVRVFRGEQTTPRHPERISDVLQSKPPHHRLLSFNTSKDKLNRRTSPARKSAPTTFFRKTDFSYRKPKPAPLTNAARRTSIKT